MKKNKNSELSGFTLETLRKFVDYWTRVKTIPRILLIGSFGILMAIFGTRLIEFLIIWVIKGSFPNDYESMFILPNWIVLWILLLCTSLILIAIFMAVHENRNQSLIKSKKRVVVIEGRGLRDDDGSSLVNSISSSLEGQRIPLLLDLRQNQDGRIVPNQRLLEKIAHMHAALLQHKTAISKDELTVVYGGFTAVPFSFLTGVLLDDESRVVSMDWDRSTEQWRELDEEDDGRDFQFEELVPITVEDEVVLAVSCSYPILQNDITSTFTLPIYRLSLDGASSSSHWSLQKQSRLAARFLETAKLLDSKGVKTIHLILAAPNSLSFNFGRRYDKRNLPIVIVYQFEKGQTPAYPWGVKMPVANNLSAELIVNNDQK